MDKKNKKETYYVVLNFKILMWNNCKNNGIWNPDSWDKGF